MRILALGAHPDDLEIFCYGLLAACKARGDELHLAVATDGAAGAVAGKDNSLAERRAAETKSALSLLAEPELLGLPDGVLSGTAGGGAGVGSGGGPTSCVHLAVCKPRPNVGTYRPASLYAFSGTIVAFRS